MFVSLREERHVKKKKDFPSVMDFTEERKNGLESARHAIKTMSEHLRQRRLIRQRTQVRPNQTAEAALQTSSGGGEGRAGEGC